MWCHSCQADVAPIDNLCDPGGESCVRCGSVLKLGDAVRLQESRILSNPTRLMDDLWLADLDTARAKRRSHNMPLIADFKLNVLQDEPTQTGSPDIVAANLSDRLHGKQSDAAQTQAIFTRTFATLVVILVSYGLVAANQPITKISLALGSLLVLIQVTRWLSHATPSASRQKFKTQTSPVAKRAA